jgi:hypothetical protein
MRSHNGSNGTPLDPPLFWLDNTFKKNEIFSKSTESYILLLNVLQAEKNMI